MKVDSTITEKNLSIVSEYYRLYYNAGQEEVIAKNRKYVGGSIGFIPIKLNVTLDGISGLKIYQKIQFNTNFLPVEYAESIEFIIVGVEHKLKDNDWETDIKCVMIPKFEEYTKILTTDLYTYIKPQTTTPLKTPGNATNNVADDTSSWADRVVAAAKEVFPNVASSGESTLCAQYASNVAQHLINQIIDAGFAPGKNKISTGGGWGNAWDPNFYKTALNTGFYELKQSWTVAESNTLTPTETKTLLFSEINKNAEYGDIVQYYLSDGNSGGNKSGVNRGTGPVYHTQIFTGKLARGIKDGHGDIGGGWSSSWPANYGTPFVYGSKPYQAGDKFEVYWLRIKDEYRK
jgi:hypothetical protein